MNQEEKTECLMKIQSTDIQYNEYITIARKAEKIQKTTGANKSSEFFEFYHFQSYKEAIVFMRNHQKNNLFFVLGLTDGQGQKDKNIKSANLIAIDLDFKDKPMPSEREITKYVRKKCGLYITALVNSGHGYHIYFQIEKTEDIKLWNQTTKRLSKLLGGDALASRKSQILRFPSSINYKDKNNPKKCNVIFCNPGNPYSLSKINKIIDNYEYSENIKEYSKIKPCVENMMKGVDKGYRDIALSFIVLELKKLNYSFERTKKEALKFNAKCNPPQSESFVITCLNNLWNNNNYKFSGCNHQDERKNAVAKRYCPGDCVFKNKFLSFKSKDTTIKIPSNFISFNVLRQCKGTEISLLLYIYFCKTIDKNDLYNYCCRSTINKYLNHLKLLNFIDVDKKSVTIRTNYSPKIDIDSKVMTLCLNKKITESEALIYYCIVWLNSINERTTIQHISEMLGKNKSNVSPVVQGLAEKGLVNDYLIFNGNNYCHSLRA